MHDPTNRFGGVDWATDAHAVCVVDTDGAVRAEFDVAHTAEGLAELCRRVAMAGVARVAIERPDGPVVDALMEAGLEIVVVSSRSVKALRERYGTAGNKSDRSDAYVLADCLRTDGHRWPSLQPDSPATVTLRAHVRARRDLVETRVATANQLRAHLQIVFPGAVGLFRDIDSPISLRFLGRFPSAGRAGWLSERRLGAWLRANSYSGRKTPAELFGRLSTAPRGLTGDDRDSRAGVTIAFVAVLVTLRAQIDELTTRIAELLDAHPDAAIFQSLPRAGTIRAAEIGDCRARFPEPEALGDSWRGNTWAEHRYRQLRADGKTHPHAERILARSWAHIIWRCWQDGVPYDPAKHTALQHLLKEAA
jgi:transposase